MTTTLIIKGEEKELTLREMCEEHNKLWQYVVDARKNGDEMEVEDIKEKYLKAKDIFDGTGHILCNHCFLCEYTTQFDSGIPDCSMCPKTWTEEVERNLWWGVMCGIEVDENGYDIEDYNLDECEKSHFNTPPINYALSDPSLVLLTEEEILEAIRREEEYEEKYCK